MKIEPISQDIAFGLISQAHYSRVMPKITHVCYGGFVDGKLLAVITLGWGVRPLHTIRRLFPSLVPADYWEIGKLCLDDALPRNSESQFLSAIIKLVKVNYPEKKLIFTWADGIMGKVGYVYQAANFLYGGYIWTDTYLTQQGEKVHPRTCQAIMRVNPDPTRIARPSDSQLEVLNIAHVQGKQFRYCYPLKSRRENRALLESSTVEWSLSHPKEQDLAWKQKVDGHWIYVPQPQITTAYHYNKVRPVAEARQGILL